MRNVQQASFSEVVDQNRESAVGTYLQYWWRRGGQDELNENGLPKMDDECDLSKMKPRFKVVREMERLGMIANSESEGLDDLRHKLISYRSGDFWLPIGGINKDELDIPPVNTILLVGLSASGKSSLLNLMYSVLGRSGLIPFSQTSSTNEGSGSNYTTMYLEEHNVLRSMRSGFCVYDTRGLDPNKMGEGLDEVHGWMTDGVRHNQPCTRPGDHSNNINILARDLSSRRFARRKVNCAMVVVNLADIFKCGDMKPLEATKHLFNSHSITNSNEKPIVILTHGDMLPTEDRINARLKVCQYLGVSEITGAYDIPCLTAQGILAEESDPITSFALAEAVYRALLQSDRTHLPKRKWRDCMVIVVSWIMCSIAAFFAMLASIFSTLGHKNNKLKM